MRHERSCSESFPVRETGNTGEGSNYDRAISVLHRYWGHASFRAGQYQIVESVLQGRDVVAILPTGGGKSICYQVPALLLHGLTLVVSPLISLMEDQVRALRARGIPAESLSGTLSSVDIESRLNLVRLGRVRLLYVSPERLQSVMFRRWLPQLNVRLLAIDEAHCISEWGHDFRPDYRRIPEIYDRMNRPPLLALTATATPLVRADIVQSLSLHQPVMVTRGFDRANLIFSVLRTHGKRTKISEILQVVPGSAIIYAPTRSSVDRWTHFLARSGVSVCAYHAGLSPGVRADAQLHWQHGRNRVMVATNAFGMGIDKSDVRSVTHIGLPSSLEGYYQEAGRAGRDGRKAYATLVFDAEDLERHRLLIKRPDWRISGWFEDSRSERRRRSQLRRRLKDTMSYARSRICRRQQLLAHFGDYSLRRCRACDVCLGRHRMYAPLPEEAHVFIQLLGMIERGESPYLWAMESGIPKYRVEPMVEWMARHGYIELPQDLPRKPSQKPSQKCGAIPRLTRLGRRVVASDSADRAPDCTVRRSGRVP